MYIKKVVFQEELVKSFESGILTNKCVDYFMRIAKEMSKRLKYKDEIDREDCIQEGLYYAIKYWKNYDINHNSANPFSYFSQLIKCGMVGGFSKIHGKKNKRVQKISLQDNFNF